MEHEERVHYAYSAITPNNVANGVLDLATMIANVKSSGGTFNKASNILATEITLTTSDTSAATSTDLYDINHHESVSTFLRLKFLGNFVVKVRSSWQKLVNNIVIIIKVNLPDGTSAQMYLHNPWSSFESYKLKKDSVKDANGISIPRDGSHSGSSGDMSYSNNYSAGNYFNLYQVCRDYSIKSSDGSWWRGTACFYRTYP